MYKNVLEKIYTIGQEKTHTGNSCFYINLKWNSIVSYSSFVDKNYLYTYNFVTKILSQYFMNKPTCFPCHMNISCYDNKYWEYK